MKLPKELTTVTPLSKILALALFIKLPIIFFFLGMHYQNEIYKKISVTPSFIATQSTTPTASTKLQPPPYGRVSIEGTIIAYDMVPEIIDGPPTLMIQHSQGYLYEVLLPSGESSCTLPAETNNIIRSLKVGDTIEVYGTPTTTERIIICYPDEYIHIISI